MSNSPAWNDINPTAGGGARLDHATHKVCALVPLKWLSSETRYAFFMETKPQILIFSERPSMPPGDQIVAMGKNAYRRGKVDYMWLVWDKQRPNRDHAPTLWIPPREKQAIAA